MPNIRDLAAKLGLATWALSAMVWTSACGVGAVSVADSSLQNAGQQSPVVAADPAASAGTPAPAPAGAPAGTTLTGAVASHSFTPKSAIFAVVNTGGSKVLAVKLSDQADDCALIGNNAHRHGAMSFWLRLAGDAKNGATFAIDGSTDASVTSATQYVLDDACNSLLDDAAAWATEGKATLETVSDAKVSGTFNVMVGSQKDAVQGTFAAVPCVAMETLIKAPDSARTCE